MLHCRKVEKEENAMNRRYSMGGGGANPLVARVSAILNVAIL